MNDLEISQRAVHSEALLSKTGANLNFLLETVFPVGSCIEANLTEAQFYAQGYSASKWVLADGRSVSGSLYHQITGNVNVPDRRGRYARMKDNGAGVNPDGELGVGATQEDINKGHLHALADDGGHDHGGSGASGSHSHTLEPGGAHAHKVMVDPDIYVGLGGPAPGPAIETESTDKSYRDGVGVFGNTKPFVEESGEHSHTLTLDTNQNHNHSIEEAAAHTHTMGLSGSVELRPKTITVNVFMRIN